MTRGTAGAVAAVAVPPLLLAAVGLAHPHTLNDESAVRWLALHVVLLPLFPLLGLAPWLVARDAGRAASVVTAVLGYVYGACYGALDVLAGIGGGALQRGGAGDVKPVLYEWADRLGAVGVWAYLAASVVAAAVALRRTGVPALYGVVLVLAGGVSYLTSHVYWPEGVLTMLALAAGWTSLVWLGRGRARTAGA